jgi:MFS family permease
MISPRNVDFFGFCVGIIQRDFAFSLVCLGAIVGSLISGALADRIGRRRALMLTALPFIGGIFLMAYWISLPGTH